MSRPVAIGAALVALGVLAWIIVGGIALVDSLIIGATPTPLPTRLSSATPLPITAVMLQPTHPPAMTATITVTPLLVMPTQEGNKPSVMPSATASSASSTPAIAVMIVTSQNTLQGTLQATVVPNNTPNNNGCTPPPGWVPYKVQDGDTLFGFQLGSNNAVDVKTLLAGNCLKTSFLALGQTLYLPPGAANNAPKVDNSSGPDVPALPAGASRTPNCPCTINVIAGWRLEQIAAAIDKTPVGFSGKDFLATVAGGAPVPSEFGFLSSRPAGKSLEGFMLPGEYTLENATSAIQFRDMMLKAFGAAVGADLQAAAASHGLNFWQAVVLASIIEREARAPDSQKLAASLFYNRMAKGMALGTFVTMQYAIGQAGAWWPNLSRADIYSDNRYNLAKYAGLPPSAIDSPDLSAIQAVAYPPQTDYLYVSAKCDGSGNFYTNNYADFLKQLNCN